MRSRRRKALSWAACSALASASAVVGCVIAYDYSSDATMARSDGGDGSPDASFASARPWGEYAKSLAVRACASDGALVVNTTADRLPGSGRPGELTFREALALSIERPGPDAITFDPAVFSTANSATIDVGALTGESVAPLGLEEVCIDGRDRGVVVRWLSSGLAFDLGKSSLMVGVTLIGSTPSITVSDSQVAGCRIGTDGRLGYGGTKRHVQSVLGDYEHDDRVVLVSNVDFGPGNAVFGTVTNLSPYLPSAGVVELPSRIVGNFFGVDPVTDAVYVPAVVALHLRHGTVENNVFVNAQHVLMVPSPANLVFNGNRVGVRSDGGLLDDNRGGLVLGHSVLGSRGAEIVSNVLRGAPVAIRHDARLPSSTSTIRISRNSIVASDDAIQHSTASPVDPPIVESVDAAADIIRGTCQQPGLVEVFSDRGASAETYVGDATCGAGGTWTLLADVAAIRGRNITATLTIALAPDQYFDGGPFTTALSSPYAVN